MPNSSGGYYAGVDIGASTGKVAIIGEDGELAGFAVDRSGTDFAARAEELLNRALGHAQLDRNQINKCVSTGYGRRNVLFANTNRTEISCHALACYSHFKTAMTVIDIGGQDNKIIKLDQQGRRTNFKMNRKCAAGTGAFLEEMASRLEIPLGSMNALAARAENAVELGSFCTVFTATEILEKIRAGRQLPEIVKGIYLSIAKRIIEMDVITDLVVMTGGVAEHNPVLIGIIKNMIGRDVVTPPHPQLMGAYGAALYARNEISET